MTEIQRPSEVQAQNTQAKEHEKPIKTSLLVLAVESRDLSGIVSPGRGGAIETLADGIFGIDRNGRLFFVAPDGAVSTAPSNIETNGDAYYALDQVIEQEKKFIKANQFRVIDLAVRRHDATSEIIVAHNYYHVDRRCVSLRVSVLAVSDVLDVFASPPKPSDWQVIFETEPCLALKFDDRREGPVFQNGHVSGGRMVIEGDGSIVIGIGDFFNNGVDEPMILPQDDDTPYGKIIRLAGHDGAYGVVSKGHRNPQGLALSRDGSLYETEHGPRGGDELNLIAAGRNYGWPLVTLGTNYGSMTWPLNAHQGRHDSYERPLFAWVPAIGISSLIEIHDFASEWSGDLLIASLKDKALWRTRVVGGRILLTERFGIGSRIRDLVETADRRIVLWTEDAKLVVLTRAEAE